MICPSVSKHINTPSKSLCLHMLHEYGTPANVIGHCKAVTDTALRIGKGLCRHGHSVNLKLLEAAALLHDIARVEDEHWIKGAEILREKGYPEVADIILPHMTYAPESDRGEIGELDILCLSDRMVKDDKYVGLEARMQFVLDHYKDNPEAYRRIQEKMEINKKLRQRIEEIIGKTMDEIMEE